MHRTSFNFWPGPLGLEKSSNLRRNFKPGLIGLTAIALLTTAIALRAAPADPSYYRKMSTWQDSMLASLEALAKENVEDGFPAFDSGILRGGQPPQRLSVPLSGAKEMYLFVTGDPDVKWGVADWADARLIARDGTATSFGNSNRFQALLGRHELNLTLRSGLYQKMRLGERVFDRGLHVQANSVVLVPLDRKYERFEAWIGIDDWAGKNGHVRFRVAGSRTAARLRLWEWLARDFPEAAPRQQISWEREDQVFDQDWLAGNFVELARRYAKACHRVPPLMQQAVQLAGNVRDKTGLEQVRQLYYESRRLDQALTKLRQYDFEALRLAIEDLTRSFPAEYARGRSFLGRLDELEKESRDAFSERALGGTGYQPVPSGNLPDGTGATSMNSPGAVLPATPTSIPVGRLPTGAGRLPAPPFVHTHPDGAFEKVARLTEDLEALKREALLANPLLDFDRLMVVKRKPIGDPRRSQWEGFGLGEYLGVPRQSSWANGTMPNVDRWTNELAVLSPVRPNGQLNTLFKPDARQLITDVDLHFNADKLLFSMPDKRKHWQIFELSLAASDTKDARPPASGSSASEKRTSDSNSTASSPNLTALRQLTPGDQPEVHCYDSCYLPDGRILFISTAVLQGVPCNAGVIVGMMYQMDADGKNIHQVCFEQDHDYNPSVMNDGRVLYLRWDYTDTPHVWNRILMSMNPDATGQTAYYGGNSYWPNAVFYSRAIPQHPTKIVGIVTGHHEGRVGELVIFDPAQGTQETAGVVQRIPGRGQKVEPRIEDKLTEHSWPKFLHPWPLSEKYFLVAGKPEPDSLWGIYLVDVFDNMVLVREEEQFALLEPIPFRPRSTPPPIPDKAHPAQNDALVYLQDIYHGPGLKDVPRGTVKSLRLFTYHFGYQTLAGIDHRVGADGPWETKRVLGTVPVETDGSAWFRIPAKTPISVQPLDAEGKAVALMRSWMTAMPGENLSCVGCHEQSSAVPPVQSALALARAPSEIKPWRGPVRGFSFAREVQPVLDRYCVGCHDGQTQTDGQTTLDLRRDQDAYVVYEHGKVDGKVIRHVSKKDLLGKYSAVFEPSYVALRQFVRVGGLESDLHILPPKEFHADTSELIQMLQKGHYNVRLDEEAWDRLVTWIDLNAPCHGNWAEVTRLPGNQRERRMDLRKLYGGITEDWEEPAEPVADPIVPVMPEPLPKTTAQTVTAANWPLSAEQARQLQAAGAATRTVELGDGVKMAFVRIPAGTFVMGDTQGAPDEQPASIIRIEQPFWMAAQEVSNQQYAQFDPSHDSRFEHRSSWIFSEEYLGWRLNRPNQPVVRVSWQEAMAFCRWLSAKLGQEVSLPTEAQWEYACRAGTATPFSFGNLDTDFSAFANLADVNLRKLADEGWRPKAPDLAPRDSRFDDHALVTIEVGHYRPNAWGLCDMHGNAAEWTRTTYRPYPYLENDGRNEISGTGKKIVRGGSWRDRPKLARSASRLSYPAYQKVFNVGFRVILESSSKSVAAAK